MYLTTRITAQPHQEQRRQQAWQRNHGFCRRQGDRLQEYQLEGGRSPRRIAAIRHSADRVRRCSWRNAGLEPHPIHLRGSDLPRHWRARHAWLVHYILDASHHLISGYRQHGIWGPPGCAATKGKADHIRIGCSWRLMQVMLLNTLPIVNNSSI